MKQFWEFNTFGFLFGWLQRRIFCKQNQATADEKIQKQKLCPKQIQMFTVNKSGKTYPKSHTNNFGIYIGPPTPLHTTISANGNVDSAVLPNGDSQWRHPNSHVWDTTDPRPVPTSNGCDLLPTTLNSRNLSRAICWDWCWMSRQIQYPRSRGKKHRNEDKNSHLISKKFGISKICWRSSHLQEWL